MSSIQEIKGFPVTLDYEAISASLTAGHPAGWHESLLRSYHILAKVKEWLSLGAPPSVVLELIEELETTP